MLFLNNIKDNKLYRVKALYNDVDFKRRILDIGLVPNCLISKQFDGVSGGISAYKINETLIAIRDFDASFIEVYEDEV